MVAAASAQSIRGEGATLFVNEYPVFTLRVTLDGLTPTRRIEAIVANLRKDGMNGAVTVTERKGDLVIFCGTVRVVRVTPREAQLAGVSLRQLADEWRTSVETALRLPSIYLPENQIRIAPKTPTVVKVMGAAAPTAEILNAPGSSLVARRVPGGIEVTAEEPGTQRLILRSGLLEATLTVEVQAPAISDLPRELEATVIGDPAPARDILGAAQNAVHAHFRSMPDVKVEILDTASAPLGVGERRPFNVRTRLTSPKGAPIVVDIPVFIRNEAVRFSKETELWYSNSPESVLRPQTVFHRSLKMGDTVRMLYHHMNASTEPMEMQVMVYNLSALPAKLAVIAGDGEPDTDPVRVGLDAGDQFLRGLLKRETTVADIPPRSAVPIAFRRLNPGMTMSGLTYLRLIEGGPQRLLVRTEAVRATGQGNPAQIASVGQTGGFPFFPPRPFTVNPPDQAESKAVFAAPYKELSATFLVGGRQTTLRIGEKAIASRHTEKVLDGNYGVLYTTDLTLENPTPRVANVHLEFEASAGYSGCLIAINGNVRKMPVVQTKEVILLESIRLAPGEKRSLTLQTLPLSGSSYPATITVRLAPTIIPLRPMDTAPGGP